MSIKNGATSQKKQICLAEYQHFINLY